MTSLADLLDPDQWMTSGKNLTAHVERWSKRVMEALGRRGGDKVGDVFVEDYLRELWERSRASS